MTFPHWSYSPYILPLTWLLIIYCVVNVMVWFSCFSGGCLRGFTVSELLTTPRRGRTNSRQQLDFATPARRRRHHERRERRQAEERARYDRELLERYHEQESQRWADFYQERMESRQQSSTSTGLAEIPEVDERDLEMMSVSETDSGLDR